MEIAELWILWFILHGIVKCPIWQIVLNLWLFLFGNGKAPYLPDSIRFMLLQWSYRDHMCNLQKFSSPIF